MSFNTESWTLEKLEELIKNQVQESLTLDYKDSRSLGKSDGKKNEISKDVSAFANSAGGTIIYGIQEENHLPKCIDEGVDPDEFSKEWLEQVISSRIQRKIDDIRIYPISTQSDLNKVIYVVEIPQSSRAPHQASDKRFYKRYNFKSEPMEEYEIRDIANRQEAPKLQIISALEGKVLRIELDKTLKYFSFDCEFFLDNIALEPAFHAFVNILIPENLSFVDYPQAKAIDGLKRHLYTYSNIYQQPIIQGIQAGFNCSKLSIPYPKSEQSYPIFWSVQAPKMSKQLGIYFLNIFQKDSTYCITLRTKDSSEVRYGV